MTLAHWDEVEKVERDHGAVRACWTFLGEAAGSVGVGVRRIELEPGDLSTPAHVHLDAEEIFFVLGGSGLSWQGGATYEIGPGDCLVHRAGGEPHTLRGGAGGLDVLAFGPRPRTGATLLPNQGTAWLGPTWVDAGAGAHPFGREPELDWPAPSPRSATIVHRDAADPAFGGVIRLLGKSAGAVRSGLNWTSLPPNEEGAPPHCHTAEEELFVVLDGDGALELWAPASGEHPHQTEPQETHPVRRGHVVSRLPGTRISHSFRAGPDGLTYLAYGTKEPTDICYYPRSNKVFLRGIGVIARLDLLDYSDGEPS